MEECIPAAAEKAALERGTATLLLALAAADIAGAPITVTAASAPAVV